MASCKALIGNPTIPPKNRPVCGKPAEDYFWFHDSHELIDEVFKVCHEHSQIILIDQMTKARRLEALIDALRRQRDSLHKEGKGRVSETNINISKEMRILNEKIKFQYGLLNDERNKTCRWCGFPLLEPEFDSDHLTGNPFSHGDWHTKNGRRREVMMYHTVCGREFMSLKLRLSDKQLDFIRPRDKGDTSLLAFPSENS